MAIHKLRALEYLVCVVEQGGFSAAARELGVAAPSVHRLVTALEATLQTQLLDRASSPIVPTPEGVAYFERARRLVGELNELDASLRDDASAPSGTVVVAAQNVALEFVVAKCLPRFHLQYPSVHIDLIEAGTVRDVSRLKADVLVLFGWPPKQEALLRTLAHTRWLVAASPSFWARHGVPRHPSELSDIRVRSFGRAMAKSFVAGRSRAATSGSMWTSMAGSSATTASRWTRRCSRGSWSLE